MESSQPYEGAEECHSSESGWTMYLSSPINVDDDDDQQSDDGDGKNYYHEDDSDDSMVSDASSGPSHQGIPHFKDKQDNDDGEKKPKKRTEKQKTERMRRKEEKEEVGFMARRAKTATATQAGSKQQVRKSISWMGKRK